MGSKRAARIKRWKEWLNTNPSQPLTRVAIKISDMRTDNLEQLANRLDQFQALLVPHIGSVPVDPAALQPRLRVWSWDPDRILVREQGENSWEILVRRGFESYLYPPDHMTEHALPPTYEMMANP